MFWAPLDPTSFNIGLATGIPCISILDMFDGEIFPFSYELNSYLKMN